MAWDYPQTLLEISRDPKFVDDKVGLAKLIVDDAELTSAITQGRLVCAKRPVEPGRSLYIGCYGSPSCGDYMSLFLLVNDKTNTVEQASYENFGCTSSIGASEMGAMMIMENADFEGGVFREVSEGHAQPLITNRDIIKRLSDLDDSGKVIKGVPQQKHHCSVMFEQALRNLLRTRKHGDLYSDTAQELVEQEEGPLVCHCFDVHERMIVDLFPGINEEVRGLMSSGDVDPEDKEGIVQYFHDRVRESTKAGEACGKCHHERRPSIESLVLREFPDYNPRVDGRIDVPEAKQEERPFENLTFFEKVLRIQGVIDDHVRPSIESHGGQISFENLEGDTVEVKLGGACSGCVAKALTLAGQVQTTLRQRLYDRLEVRDIDSGI